MTQQGRKPTAVYPNAGSGPNLYCIGATICGPYEISRGAVWSGDPTPEHVDQAFLAGMRREQFNRTIYWRSYALPHRLGEWVRRLGIVQRQIARLAEKGDQ